MTAPSNLREALEPFANCVFNDNGDVTIDTSHLRREDYLRAKAALATLSRPDGEKREAHPIGQGLLRTQEIMQAETMKAKIAALAHRFWSIHPSEIAAKNLTREEFYIREMTALLSSVQDGAAIPEGYALVPVEPTPEIIHAMHHQIDWCRNDQNTYELEHPSQQRQSGVGTTCKQDICDAYRAMIRIAIRSRSDGGDS